MSTAESVRTELVHLLKGRVDGTALRWFEDAQIASNLSALQQCLGHLRKGLGRRHLVAAFAERDKVELQTPWGPMHYGHWRVDEAARIWLMSAVASRQERPYAFLFEVYSQGETETRVAALRALNFVEDDDVESGLNLIRDAGRTYLEELLSAAWCNHPFATEHLSNQEYRKAVLKAVFCDVPIDGFIGLESRADEEMAASLNDFANEREAAGRTVPDAVWIVSALKPRPGLVARLVGRLEHPLPHERLVAARALGNAGDPRAHTFLQERLSREDVPEVAETIRAAMAVSGPTS